MITNWFDTPVAQTYDDGAEPFPDPAVDLLTALAQPSGQALEFAIGTGRAALPLAGRGVRVAGIELSEAMVRRLREKPGGDPAALPVAIGDMASHRIDGRFDLVFLVFNTIMNLTTQQAQLACFGNAAQHLRPGGSFVIETMVPQLRALPPGQRFVPFEVDERHLGVDEYDVVTQGLISHHVSTDVTGLVARSATPFRYVWPSELDLMAHCHGLRLRDRWADWERSPFTADSRSHVSVWSLA